MIRASSGNASSSSYPASTLLFDPLLPDAAIGKYSGTRSFADNTSVMKLHDTKGYYSVAAEVSALAYPTTSNANTASGSIGFTFTPTATTSGTVYLFGSTVDANNGTYILHDGTNLIFRKRIAGVNYDSTKAFAYVNGTAYYIAAAWNALGAKISVDGSLSTTNTNAAALQLTTSMEIGANGASASQPTAYIKNLLLSSNAANQFDIPTAYRNYATRCETPNTQLSNGANVGGSSHIRHTNKVAFSKIKAVFPLYYISVTGSVVTDTIKSASITFAGSIEYPYGSNTRYPFLFSGVAKPTATGTSLGGYAVTDELDLGFTIPAGTAFGIQFFTNDGSHATQFGGVFINTTNVEGASYSATPVDYTQTNGIGTSSQFAIGASLLLTQGNLPCVAIAGDSIATGAGGSASGDNNGNMGWIAKWIDSLGYGYCKLTCPSERMNDVPTNWAVRSKLLQLANPTVIVSEYGTNDLKTGVATTLAALQALKAAELAYYKTLVGDVPVIGCTWIPRTTSANNYIDRAGQSGQVNFTPIGGSVREEWNSYYRTNNGIFSNVASVCPSIEDGVDSGYWAFDGTNNKYTADGTHPTEFAHNLMAVSASATSISNKLILA